MPYWDIPIFNNPFEGPFGYSGPQHPAWPQPKHEQLLRTEPDPVPWSVGFLVSAASSKIAAEYMSDKSAAQRIIAAADASIASFMDSDDICPRWPWPGPPPWLSIIASELTLVANTLQEGSLRTGILRVAGQVLDRAQAVATGTAARGAIAGSAAGS
jgi:hypothetical protein